MTDTRLPRSLVDVATLIAFGGLSIGSQAAFASGLPATPAYYGVVDLHGAQTLGSADYWKPDGSLDRTELWDTKILGGSAQGTVVIGPSFSLQGDAWTNTHYYVPRSSPSYWSLNTEAGTSLHATWRANNNALVGALASFGTQLASDSVGNPYTQNFYDNVGIEGAYDVGAIWFYSQLGVVTSLDSAKELPLTQRSTPPTL